MTTNLNPQEVEKFDRIGSQWWDVNGPFQLLHVLNPCRISFIEKYVSLSGKKVIDIGCGGGLLSESLAKAGARVTGIDMSEEGLTAARKHAHSSGLSIHYHHTMAEAFSEKHPHQFDVVVCMELLEHVPDPQSLIQACAILLKPQGHCFISTLNRTPKSFWLAIVGAEYLLNLLPRGTHHFGQFIRPSELEAWANQQRLILKHLSGMTYNPLTRRAHLSDDLSINYLAHFQQFSVN